MKERYLIVSDLDGTLLTDHKTMPKRVKDAISEVCHLGHIFVLATGRAFYASRHFHKELSLDTLIVNRNGAHIHHPYKPFVESLPYQLDKKDLAEIINSKLNPNIQEIYFELNKDLYVNKGQLKYFVNRNYYFKRIFYSEKIRDCQVCVLLVDNDKVNDFAVLLRNYSAIRFEIWYHHGEFPNTLIELLPVEINKGKALDHLCNYYHIPHQRTIAFGDEINDIEMIKKAKFGVAPKNAVSELKQCADIVLDIDNNEAAVGKFVEEFFNLSLISK